VSWIRSLQGKSGFHESFESYRGLEKVRKLDAAFRPEVEEFVQSWNVSNLFIMVCLVPFHKNVKS
jgi:hypothetical protein